MEVYEKFVLLFSSIWEKYVEAFVQFYKDYCDIYWFSKYKPKKSKNFNSNKILEYNSNP